MMVTSSKGTTSSNYNIEANKPEKPVTMPSNFTKKTSFFNTFNDDIGEPKEIAAPAQPASKIRENLIKKQESYAVSNSDIAGFENVFFRGGEEEKP